MFSTATALAVLVGAASGAGTALLIHRILRARLIAAVRDMKQALSEYEARAESFEEEAIQFLGELCQQQVGTQVATAMSEVLGAMAAAEQQKAQMAQAQAQAAELERLRAIAQRAQQQPQQIPQVQITDALSEMNERMNAIAGRMRQAGVSQ